MSVFNQTHINKILIRLPKIIYFFVALYLLIVILAGAISPENYSTLTHTVSQLGGQNYPNAWLMRTGFVILGIASFTAALLFQRNLSGPLVIPATGLLAIYGISVLLTGAYSTISIDMNIENSQSTFHSLLAQVAGFSFMGSLGLQTIILRNHPHYLWVSLISIGLISLFSLLFFLDPQLAGVWQRALQLTSLIWLVFSVYFITRVTDVTFNTTGLNHD